MLTVGQKNNPQIILSDDYGLGEIAVNVVSAVLYGDNTAAASVRDHGDGLATVAAERKQKRVELGVIGFDAFDNVFLSFLGKVQIHTSLHVSEMIFLPADGEERAVSKG